ncbi:MAG: hypothetical protein OXC11_09720 [Rhodospirillales bacterium]|nr:hypothetical protein [Rhodospirillales bacterium]
MTAFAQLRLEHMRLSILQLLEKVGADVGEPLLRSAIHGLGHRPVSLRHELEWLQDHGLVGLIETAGAPKVRLSEYGYSVAGGDESVAGVARPRPGDR